MSAIKKALLGLAAAALAGLAACGGTGAGAGGSPESPLTAPASVATAVIVTASNSVINSDGTSSVTIFAIVKDANNVAMPGQPVAFSKTDAGSILSDAAPETDATGTVTAALVTADPTLRDIVVTATSGTATGSTTVRVVTAGSSAGSMNVGVSSPTMDSDGASPVTIVATVKDGNNVAMSGQAVVFSTLDSGAILTVTSPGTDGTGTAAATLAITDGTNRDIVVTATSGAATGSVTVRVAGSILTFEGPSSVAFGGTSQYTVTLKDSSGATVSGATVVLKSLLNNRVGTASEGSDVTDSSGQARFVVTSLFAGEDTLRAGAQGVGQSRQVTVSNDVATVSLEVPGADVLVNKDETVTARFLSGGMPLPNTTIQFSATRGELSANTAMTDEDGIATVTVRSASAGWSSISAAAATGPNATVDFEFVSRTPTSVWLQASPTSIPVNQNGSSSSTSALLARVKDASNNPVKGVRVDFSADADPSNGSISPASGITDSAGVASTLFIAGPNSSGYNLVEVRARVPSTGHTHTSKLTVAAQALSVRVHTGNEIVRSDPQAYLLPYAAVVSDAAGNPVAGAAVTVSYLPAVFVKGQYVDAVADSGSDTDTGWLRKVAAVCDSEDANSNGVMDALEDLNGNDTLDPGNVATAFVTTPGGRTDESGFALIEIKYPRGYANWVGILLQVTITAASGTETIVTTPILLPALGEDLSSTDVSPPGGSASRFGTSQGCNDPP